MSNSDQQSTVSDQLDNSDETWRDIVRSFDETLKQAYALFESIRQEDRDARMAAAYCKDNRK